MLHEVKLQFMKKIFTLLLLSAPVIPALSQKKFSISVFAGSGGSWYAGTGSTRTTTYYKSDVLGMPDYNDHYFGRYMAAITQAGLQLKYHLASAWFVAFNAAHEYAGGRLNIYKSVSRQGTENINADYSRHYQFLSFNPELGRSFGSKKLKLTVHAGIDCAPALEASELYWFYSDAGTTSNGYSGGEPQTTDWRLTGGFSVGVNKWSLGMNYKHGLTGKWEKIYSDVYLRMWQMRIMYRIVRL